MARILKQEESEKHSAIIDDCIRQGGGYFEAYFMKKMGRELTNEDLPVEDKDIFKEFVAKAQFFQHKSGYGEGYVNFLSAVSQPSNFSHISFSKEDSSSLFDGFLHFIIANEKDSKFLEYIIKEWVNAGRSLTEIDNSSGKQFTPLSLAVYHNNIEAFKLLLQNNIDITVLDNDGFAPLHKIIGQIHKEVMDISVLKLWIENGLPIDTKDKDGNNALYYAKCFKLKNVIQLLEGKDEIEVASESEQESFLGTVEKVLNTKNLTKAILEGDFTYFERNFNEGLKIYIDVNGNRIEKNLIEGITTLHDLKLITREKAAKFIEIISTKISLKGSKDCAVALAIAIMKDSTEQIKYLIDNGADINYGNSEIIKSIIRNKNPYSKFEDTVNGRKENLKKLLKIALSNGALISEEIKQEYPYITLLLDEIAEGEYKFLDTNIKFSPLADAFMHKNVEEIGRLVAR